jgi:eukaryotic-like serine/threonine-protein kinase
VSSRRRRELTARLRARGQPVAIWLARAEALRSGSPLDLLAQLVRAGTSLGDEPDLERARERLRARVRLRVAREEDRAELAEFLGEIVDVPFSDEGCPRLAAAHRDARLMADSMLHAWLTLLEAECAMHPVVLVMEDLHWGDAQTVRYVDAALRELKNKPLFVIALARPEVHERFGDLWRDREAQELRLGALSPRACERLVRDVLGDVDPALVQRVVAHAEGNALFLEELIRAAAKGVLDAAPASVLASSASRSGVTASRPSSATRARPPPPSSRSTGSWTER